MKMEFLKSLGGGGEGGLPVSACLLFGILPAAFVSSSSV